MKQAFQKNFYTKCNITCNALFFNRVARKITNKKPNLNVFLNRGEVPLSPFQEKQ